METAQATEKKVLYRVISVAPRFPHRGRMYKDVQITWLVMRGHTDEPPVPYEEAISEYDPTDEYRIYHEDCVRELATEAEAKALQAYLLAAHNDSATSIEEVALPWKCKGTHPLLGVPFGGPCDCYELYQEPEYNLHFKVGGFFDVRGYECVEDDMSKDIMRTDRTRPAF